MATIMITGANTGLGYEVTRQLLRQDHRVVAACRSLDKARQVQAALAADTPDRLVPVELDLASLHSVAACVCDLLVPVSALICNAGLSYETPTRYTRNGVEETFGVNHLGHALLVNLLLVQGQPLQRILLVSSDAHNPDKTKGFFPAPDLLPLEGLAYPADRPGDKPGVVGARRYVNSKLCNVLFAYELARRLPAYGYPDCRVNAFNPGFVPETNLGRGTSPVNRWLLRHVLPRMRWLLPGIRSVATSASDMIACCLETEASGLYFDGRTPVASSGLSYDTRLAADLWDLSRDLCQRLLPGTPWLD
ncbi:MAG: protochlorophyllide reductase [Bacteroidia bacterium]